MWAYVLTRASSEIPTRTDKHQILLLITNGDGLHTMVMQKKSMQRP